MSKFVIVNRADCEKVIKPSSTRRVGHFEATIALSEIQKRDSSFPKIAFNNYDAALNQLMQNWRHLGELREIKNEIEKFPLIMEVDEETRPIFIHPIYPSKYQNELQRIQEEMQKPDSILDDINIVYQLRELLKNDANTTPNDFFLNFTLHPFNKRTGVHYCYDWNAIPAGIITPLRQEILDVSAAMLPREEYIELAIKIAEEELKEFDHSWFRFYPISTKKTKLQESINLGDPLAIVNSLSIRRWDSEILPKSFSNFIKNMAGIDVRRDMSQRMIKNTRKV